jgi:hypothetical protein
MGGDKRRIGERVRGPQTRPLDTEREANDFAGVNAVWAVPYGRPNPRLFDPE